MTVFLSNITASDPTSAEVNTSVAITIHAQDDAGNPVSGYQVEIVCPNDPAYPGAKLATYTGTTGGGGDVILVPRTNTIQGTWQGTAYGSVSPYVSCSFGVSNTASTQPATPSRLEVVWGNNQQVEPGQPTGTGFITRVYDQYNNPWPSGANVTFTAPASGASGTFNSTGTRTETVASEAGTGNAVASQFTCNSTTGTFYVVCSSPGCNNVNITVKIVYGAEVCTPASEMAQAWSDGSWVNPNNWSDTQTVYTSTSVSPYETAAHNMSMFDVSAALAGVPGTSRVTSITMEHYLYFGRAAANGPTRINVTPSTNNTGALGAAKQNNKGATPDSTYVKFTNVWTSFTNTGNPGNELFISQINQPNGTGGLGVSLTYPANEGDVSGDIRANRMRIIICYVPAGTTEEVSVPLLFCGE